MQQYTTLFLLFFCATLHAQTATLFGTISDSKSEQGIPNTTIFIQEMTQQKTSNSTGEYRFENLKAGTYNVVFYADLFNQKTVEIKLKDGQGYELNVELDSLGYNLEAVEIEGKNKQTQVIRRLRNVEGFGIYQAKKTEVIELDNLVANLATNNARQVYKGIAGLNIWENDGGGLQLSIGARGLDPNRTSNFNTRQNGYDISADALGYPESYYTPPTQALERIEVVRGAASLQYGPQFGGLLNFVFKKGNEDKALEIQTENTVGSFGLLTTFNSLGGSKNGWNYYTFYQGKQGNGWRPNAGFFQNTAYASVSKLIGNRLKITAEYTYMNYLAQQAGGLQDFEFLQDARQSKRERNWFKVNWNLAALHADYFISDKTKINSRFFLLSAQRQALGELGPINRPDPLRERDLVRGLYDNFGNETRLIHRYQIGQQLITFLLGARYYQGYTQNQQGLADATAAPNFSFLNPNELEKSDYVFPSRNVAVFAENLFNINTRWSITPGVRYEYIRTASEGFYRIREVSGGQVFFEEKVEQNKENSRQVVLFGLGVGHKITSKIEAYTNFSQNYRSINFTDLAVINPNLIVDSLLRDERGFNVDLGLRGTALQGVFSFDASLFLLQYQDRIGTSQKVIADPVVVERSVAFRTNIGDARIVGLEAYAEADIWQLLTQKEATNMGVSIFGNASVLQGKYLTGETAIVNNDVELIPPFSLKTGINFRYKDFAASYQYAYVARHFSDATNAEFVVDATRGLIPAYAVSDVSLSYKWKRFRLQTGVNNLTDARYFTRRAPAYPGPGIVPSDGRSFYGTLGVRF